ncbi:hypothetical protein PoB_005970100 [Plakobranchus ocellatus]|uniref:Uncharacterized protein n=1 Tax=Plakobranchus ocellatus TaxID=259542 RepID=A0AAV4CMP8_9GAST|nr:hypothetical protein PoB_005970100 [Plakobranchus ocellatus]
MAIFPRSKTSKQRSADLDITHVCPGRFPPEKSSVWIPETEKSSNILRSRRGRSLANDTTEFKNSLKQAIMTETTLAPLQKLCRIFCCSFPTLSWESVSVVRINRLVTDPTKQPGLEQVYKLKV